MFLNNSGDACKVENGDDKNNSGNTNKETMNWNPSMLCILDAIIKPIPMATKDVKSMKIGTKASNKDRLKLTPRSNEINKTINPWIMAIVAPPRVVPIIMDNLLTGATRTSCKNPNCLSHKIDRPMKTEGNIIDMAIIPGAKISINLMPDGNPGIIAEPKPKPSTERKKNG